MFFPGPGVQDSPRHRLQQVTTAAGPDANAMGMPQRSGGLGTPRKSGMTPSVSMPYHNKHYFRQLL